MEEYTKEYERLNNKLQELGNYSRRLAEWCSKVCRDRHINIYHSSENRNYIDTLEERNKTLREMGEIGKEMRELVLKNE